MFFDLKLPQVGIIHAIKKFHGDLPTVNLAVSLHAPVQDIRCQIMPAARAFPLQKLMDALQEYQKNRFLFGFLFFCILFSNFSLNSLFAMIY